MRRWGVEGAVDHREKWIRHVLRRQDGVITSEQAVELGLTRSAIHTRVRTGRWERLGPRVYLSLDREYTDRVRLRAAVYSAGPGAAAHGASAAWWHSLTDTLPAVVDVTVPRGRGPQQQAGVRLRRRNLAPQDRVHFCELWVTGLPLTVLEAAAVMRDGVNLLDRALQRRVRLAALHAALKRNQHCYGARSAAAVLATATDRAGSAAERILLVLLRRAGITGWIPGYRCLGYVLDVGFPTQRLALEVDGWAWHVDAPRFQADRVRQNALVNGGWRVLRFTWDQLTNRPDAVIADVRNALSQESVAPRDTDPDECSPAGSPQPGQRNCRLSHSPSTAAGSVSGTEASPRVVNVRNDGDAPCDRSTRRHSSVASEPM